MSLQATQLSRRTVVMVSSLSLSLALLAAGYEVASPADICRVATVAGAVPRPTS